MNVTIQIIECSRCKAPQVFKEEMKDSDIPVALEVNLDGGYGMFIDNWADHDEYHLLLCHKCGHEFADWMGISLKNGHPKTDDPYCNGWTMDEAQRKEEEYLMQLLDEYEQDNQTEAKVISLESRRNNGKEA